MKKAHKNYGLNLKLEELHKNPEDYVFGAVDVQCITNIPQEEREKYFPKGEVQRGEDDMMDCASRGPINILETKFNWLFQNKKIHSSNEEWLRNNGYVTEDNRIEFSDAFIAIKSGTTRSGNSMKAPLQAIHENGLIPKRRLPLESWMQFGDYTNSTRITKDMEDLGKEFNRRFKLNYIRVYEKNYEELLEQDMINVAGFAWSIPVDGIYPVIENDPNHVFVAFKKPRYFIFDNYIDETDSDFIKRLVSNYDLLDYGYQVVISKEVVPVSKDEPMKVNWVIDLFSRLGGFIKLFFVKS